MFIKFFYYLASHFLAKLKMIIRQYKYSSVYQKYDEQNDFQIVAFAGILTLNMDVMKTMTLPPH